MDHSRRKFFQQASMLSFGAGLKPLWSSAKQEKFEAYLQLQNQQSASDIAQDEAYWHYIRQQYNFTTAYTNLENGYYSLMSNPVLQAQFDHIQQVNQQASYYFRKQMYTDRKAIKKQLANYCGVSSEELALVRNTTEAMNILIMGLPLGAGEEILYNNQDYFSMKEAIAYRAKRFGTLIRQLDLPLHTMSDAEIVEAYEKNISAHTKILLLTHLINVTGQILPVKQIAEMAKAKGVMVICDIAQSFAHFPYQLTDLGCDYIGASLHKWMGNTLGTGFLYIKKDMVANVQPLIGVVSYKESDINKFEYWGTHPAHSDLTLQAAIRFHSDIGPEKIAERLRYLRNYWRSKLLKLPNFILHTPVEDNRSCAIQSFSIKNIPPPEVEKILFNKYGIYISSIDYQGIKGNRITAHIYNTQVELDAFVQAITEIAV